MKAVKVGKIEYRIACAHHGTEGHSSHVFYLRERAKADEAVARHNAHRYEQSCKPWHVEGRAVSEWGDPDAAEMCLYAVGRTLEGRML